MPKISIITINYNNSGGLEKTINSVIPQDFNDYEHIIIDGGSTDSSIDIIKKYERQNFYWISEKDKGIYDAMNKGIKRAKGEYCIFLNSGDYFANLTVLSELLKDTNDEDLIYGDLIWVNNKGQILKIKKPAKLSAAFFVSDSLSHPSTLIKTSLFAKTNYYRTDIKILSDWAFFVEAIFKNGATHKHKSVYVTFFAKDGISSDPKNLLLMKEERDKVWKELFPYIYKDIERLHYLEKVWKIPGVKFLMEYVFPIYKKVRYFKNRKFIAADT